MIPKIIHYCWFGGNPLPKSALRCIESWKRYLPDYEIKEWNETNFDFSQCAYACEAAERKKWAFVSDYARFKILYKYGGLYFDTDVEVIKPLDDILIRGSFMGAENVPSDRDEDLKVAPGLGLAINPGLGLVKELIDTYESIHYVMEDGSVSTKTIVHITSELLKKHGLKDSTEIQNVAGVTIYPKEYFCPMHPVFKTLEITENTRTIHHYDATWLPKGEKRKKQLQKILGVRLVNKIIAIKKCLKQ